MITGRDEADRFAAGAGNTDVPRAEDDDMMPGVTAGGATHLPESRRAAPGGGAGRVEGTIGAVGEMDITGAPAEPGGAGGPSGGTGGGETRGGGTGGGSMATGGAGPSPADAGPQSGECTVAFLGDRELSTAADASGMGGAEGAGGKGWAGGSDVVGDDAVSNRDGAEAARRR